MEYLDIYDAKGGRTGRKIKRGDRLNHGEFLLVVHLCLFNKNGEMLIQKRHPSKELYPGFWDISAGGFVRSGESSSEAILRETKEELGLDLKKGNIRLALTASFSYVLDEFFITLYDIDSKKLLIQEEEISEVRWASRGEILGLLEQGQFVDYDRKLLNSCFCYAESPVTKKNGTI